MRHKKSGKKLNRNTKQRKALFLSLSKSLIEKEQIITTLTKAKVIRSFLEKLIAKARRGDQASRRKIQAVLRQRKITNKLVDEIAPIFKKRPGGFLRIIPLTQRRGDNAKMAKIEFVEKISDQKPGEKKKEKEQETGEVKNVKTKEAETKKPKNENNH